MLEYEEPALSILAGHKKVEQPQAEEVKPLIEDKDIIKVGNADKVAVFSQRNMTWQEVGKLYRGISLLEKELALKWLSRPTVRLATEQEIIKEFKWKS